MRRTQSFGQSLIKYHCILHNAVNNLFRLFLAGIRSSEGVVGSTDASKLATVTSSDKDDSGLVQAISRFIGVH